MRAGEESNFSANCNDVLEIEEALTSSFSRPDTDTSLISEICRSVFIHGAYSGNRPYAQTL